MKRAVLDGSPNFNYEAGDRYRGALLARIDQTLIAYYRRGSLLTNYKQGAFSLLLLRVCVGIGRFQIDRKYVFISN